MSGNEEPTKKPVTEENWEQFKADAKKQAHHGTFEGRIKELESVCLKTPGILPNRELDAPPPEQSRAWYAEEILRAIRSTRSLMEQGHTEHAAGEAVVVGALAAEAEALHNWREIKKWREMCERNRESARKRGRSMSDAADARVQEILAAAEEYRQEYPYDRHTSSTRSMADIIARRLGQNCNTVRYHLREHQIR